MRPRSPLTNAFVSILLLLLLLWIRQIHSGTTDQRGMLLWLFGLWVVWLPVLYLLSRGWGASEGKPPNV